MANAARIYVGGLRPDTSERELEDEFSRYGQIRSIWVARKPPGFAFVEFEDPRDAEDAVRRLDGFSGWRVEISRRPPGGGRRDEPRGGGYDGDYGRGPPRGGREMRCYECNEIGHLARDCLRRRGGGGRSPPRRRSPSPRRRDYSPRGRSRSPPRRREDDSPPRKRASPESPRDRRERSRERSPRRDSPARSPNGHASPPRARRSRSRSLTPGSPR